MTEIAGNPGRNKGYAATHEIITSAAVQLLSEVGVEGVSVSAVARLANVDRKTMYYHFKDRDALLTSAKQWVSDQLAQGLVGTGSRIERTGHISRFVLHNPQLIKLWIEDFVSPGNIRERYPEWDRLVEGMRIILANDGSDIDPEVYCTIMLTAAFIAPRVFQNSVRPDLSPDEIVSRFSREQMRTLAADTSLRFTV
jgi:AcrR family transcriptional regulator